MKRISLFIAVLFCVTIVRSQEVEVSLFSKENLTALKKGVGLKKIEKIKPLYLF